MNPTTPYIGQPVQFRDRVDQPVKAGMVTDIIAGNVIVASLSRHPNPGPNHPFYGCAYQDSDNVTGWTCWDAASTQAQLSSDAPAPSPALVKQPALPQVSDTQADDGGQGDAPAASGNAEA